MNINYPNAADNWGEDLPLVKRASDQLEQVLGSNADKISAEWKRVNYAGSTRYEVRLSDWSGDARVALSHEDLSSPHTLSFHLEMLWGRVLQNRSHIQLKNLQGMGA